MKHAILGIKDVPAKFNEFGKCARQSSLDIALDRLKEKGAKVLDFWRHGRGGWQIKTMVPKAES